MVRALLNQHVNGPRTRGHTKILWDARRCFLIEASVEQTKQKSDFFLKPRAKKSAQSHFNLLPCRQVEWSSTGCPYSCHHALVSWPASIALETWPFHPLLAAPECPIDLDKVGGSPARTGRWCRWQRRCWRRDSRRGRRELNALYSLWLIGEWAV